MLEWINNSPIMQLNLEQFTYATGLPADMYWPVFGGVFSTILATPLLSSAAPLLSM